MIRFQCSHCRGIVAAENWEPGAITTCAYCSKEVPMPNDRLAPGAVLGDFLLVRKLGAGGMGVVYLAHQLSLDRPSAIKVLNSEYSKEAESVQAFIREARSAAKLNHPNIVQAYAVGEDEGIFFFAMEFIDGKTMKEILQAEKKIDFKRAANIVMQVADALDCAWREQKLIHHDIKPDNIMQCANERVKLADLGLSQVFGEDGNDDSNEVIGTPQYISPEQLTGVITDTRSDIYSLGATFYHFVTGQFPYTAENTDEIAKMHVYGTLTPPKAVNPDLPQVLNDIIVKMMAKQPGDRYQDCGQLWQALKDYLDNADRKPIATTPVNTLTGKLGGMSPGLGGSANMQAKTLTPPGSGKLSLKIQDSKKSEPAPAPTAPESSPMSSAMPKLTPPSGGGIKIKLGSKAAPTPPDPPLQATEAAESASVTPVENAAETAGKTAPAVEAPVEAETPATVDNSTEKNAVEPEALTAGEEQSKSSEEKTSETADNKPEEKSSGSSKGTIIGVLLALLLLGGGGYGYHLYQKKQLEKSENVKVEIPVIKEKEAKAAVQEKVVEQTPQVETPAPEKRPQVVLSAAMRELKRLEELSLVNDNSFLSKWPSSSRSITAETAEEKRLYSVLDAHYVEVDERKRIEPVRTNLINAYKKLVDTRERQAIAREHIMRIREADEQAFKLAEESPENYQADLQRKMGLLDYAMITAARSRRANDWKKFEEAIALAKAEPKRVADREDFKKTAEELAAYAEHLEIVSRQGKAFTEMLLKNALRNKTVSDSSGSVTVVRSNLNSLQLRIQLNPKQPKVVPKLKPKKSVKGKAKTKTKAKTKSGNPKVKMPKPQIKNIQLLTMPVEEVARHVKLIESQLGKRDQYFYYMLYNGHLRQSLAKIAPDDYWKKRVDKVAFRYFSRALLLANAQQTAQLKKSYGQWPSFQKALKNFEAEQ